MRERMTVLGAPGRRGGTSGPPAVERAAPDLQATALALRIEALEARVARLEAARPTLEDSVPPLSPVVSGALDEVSSSGPFALAGRTLIAVGGGYLLRAVTAAGGLSAVAGTALGLLYAAAWILHAERAARRGRVVSATLATATGALLAYPLLWEASTRFAVLSGRGALAGSLVFVLLAGAIAARRGQPAFAWLHLVPALLLTLGVLVKGRDVLAVLATLALLHAAAEAAAVRYGWSGMRWATAGAAALVAIAVLTVRAPQAGAVGLLAAAIGTGALLRTLRRPPGAFDAAAVVASLAFGVWAVGTLPADRRFWPALAALGLAAAAQGAAALPHLPCSSARGLVLAATALVLAATPTVLPGAAGVAAWSVAGLLAAWWSRRDLSFRLPAAAYLAAAMASAGALASAVNGVTGAGEPASLSGAGLLAAGAALASALIAGGRGHRATRLAGAVLGGLGGAGLATSAWPTAELASAGGTAALALAAAVLSLAARGGNPALRGLAWTLLVLGGLRLLMVDVPGGQPLRLFVGLVTYGGALLAAQASRGSSGSMRETSVVKPAREAE